LDTLQKVKKKKEFASKLVEAIAFLSFAQKNNGNEMQTYCRLQNRTAIAFNGIIALGHPIDEDLFACPHMDQFSIALGSCAGPYAIAQLSEDQLQIRSGNFQAFIPCCKPAKLPEAVPDAPYRPLGAAFADALAVCAPFCSSKAETAIAASIQVHAGSVLATNIAVIIEAWHGFELPTVLIPESAADTIVKCGKVLAGFGMNEKTATFWFEDNSWLRTQRYTVEVPDLRTKLEVTSSPREIPASFFQAVKKVSEFSHDGKIYCRPQFVGSHSYQDMGANYQEPTPTDNLEPAENGLINRCYEWKHLKSVLRYADKWDENALDQGTLFFGKKLRGAVAHSVIKENAPTNFKCGDPNCDGGCDVCIPF
jgi:hypothetical protein